MSFERRKLYNNLTAAMELVAETGEWSDTTVLVGVTNALARREISLDQKTDILSLWDTLKEEDDEGRTLRRLRERWYRDLGKILDLTGIAAA